MADPRSAAPVVWFARHAESVWNDAGLVQGQAVAPGLSATGHEQARRLARRLADCPVEMVVTSDLLRAMETAEIIAEALAVPIFHEPRLRERNLGNIEGEPQARLIGEISGHDRAVVTNADARPAGGESLRELYGRVERCLEAFRTAPPAHSFVAVTHGGFLRVARNVLRGTPVEDMTWPATPNALLWRIDLSNGAVEELPDPAVAASGVVAPGTVARPDRGPGRISGAVRDTTGSAGCPVP